MRLITDDIVVSRNTAALTILFKRQCLWQCTQCFNALVVQCVCLHLTLQVQEQNVSGFYYTKIFATISCQYIVKKLWRGIEFENSIED